jgi:hypothetical protein
MAEINFLLAIGGIRSFWTFRWESGFSEVRVSIVQSCRGDPKVRALSPTRRVLQLPWLSVIVDLPAMCVSLSLLPPRYCSSRIHPPRSGLRCANHCSAIGHPPGHVRHSINHVLQSDRLFAKCCIQRLMIDSPQNFLEKGQEFIRFVE